MESEYLVPKSTTKNQLLILLVGLPQSGKSTWARQSAHPIVNRDAIRQTIGGSIRYFKEEGRVTEIEEIMADSLFNAGHHTVVIDATHLKKKYRDRWIKWAEERGLRMYIYKFLTSLEVCQQRARRNYPDEPKFPKIIRQMWETAELDFVIPEKQMET